MIALSVILDVLSLFLVIFLLKNTYYINIFALSFVSLKQNSFLPIPQKVPAEKFFMPDPKKWLDVGDLVGGFGIVAFILGAILMGVLPSDVSFIASFLPIILTGIGTALALTAFSIYRLDQRNTFRRKNLDHDSDQNAEPFSNSIIG